MHLDSVMVPIFEILPLKSSTRVMERICLSWSSIFSAQPEPNGVVSYGQVTKALVFKKLKKNKSSKLKMKISAIVSYRMHQFLT